jgi:hypothetical protein
MMPPATLTMPHWTEAGRRRRDADRYARASHDERYGRADQVLGAVFVAGAILLQQQIFASGRGRRSRHRARQCVRHWLG